MMCCFVLLSNIGSLIADAEILALVFQVLDELPWMRDKGCTIRLNHSKLLDGVLHFHAVDSKHHENVKSMLSDMKVSNVDHNFL